MASRTRVRVGMLAAGLATAVLGAQTQSQSPSADDIIAATGKYVEAYLTALSAVVSEETYTQIAQGALVSSSRQQRVLKSDLLLVRVEDASWITFRDVFEVDGSKVRDRDNRLVNLILKPARDSYEQAKRIAEESARFNLGAITRTLNAPALALMFLRPVAHPRSDFRILRTTRVDGVPVVELELAERSFPRLIETPDEAAAKVRAWIESADGKIRKTELTIQSRGSQVTVTVSYRDDQRLGLLLPAVMSEVYTTGPGGPAGSRSGSVDTESLGSSSGRIEGHATYGNFRRFTVDTSTVIKKFAPDLLTR